MATPQISANDRRDELVASAAQTNFLFTFPVDAEAELTVTLLASPYTGTPTNPTFTATLTDTGGTVILDAPATLDDRVIIEGNAVIKRSSNYLNGGEYRANDVNFDFNTHTKNLQSLRRDVDRSVQKSPATLDSVDVVLPQPEADKALAWNAMADALVNVDVDDPTAVTSDNLIPDERVVVGVGGARKVKSSLMSISASGDVSGVNDISMSGDITLGGTVDFRDVNADGGRLDTMETSADVTDEANVKTAMDGMTLSTTTTPLDGTENVFTRVGGSTEVTTSQAIADLAAATGGVGPVLQSARVDEAAGINKGQVVFISGVQGAQIEASLADNTDFDKSRVVALAFEDGDDNDTITFILLGVLADFDTTAFSEGDNLYLGTSGNLTNVHPSGINAVVLVGVCIRSHVNQGSMAVRIDTHTIIEDFNGIMRHQLVNQSNGVSAIAAYTIVNDAGHFMSLASRGTGHAQGEGVSLFAEGYGNMAFINNGNHDFVWLADVTDSHSQVNLVEVMRLTPAGLLTLLGGLTSTGDQRVVSSAPAFILEEDDATAEEGKWLIWAEGDQFRISSMPDDETITTEIITIDRSGASPAGMSINTDLTVEGDFTTGATGVNKAQLVTTLSADNGLYPSTTTGATEIQVEYSVGRRDFKCIRFPNSGGTVRAGCMFSLPEDYDGSPLTFEVYWSKTAGSSTNDFVMNVVVAAIFDGIDLTSSTGNSQSEQITPVANDEELTITSYTVTPAGVMAAPGQVVAFNLARVSGDAGDTLASAVDVLQVKVFY